MEEKGMISFFDSTGQLRSLEDVISDVEDFYEDVNPDVTSLKKGQLLQLVTDPEIQLEPMYVLPRFEMLERKCYIDDEIDEAMGTDILEKIQFWNTQDEYDERKINERKPIQIYINTCGGDVVSAFQIIDAIKTSKTPVYTIVTGEAISGGFLIAIVGHKRYGFENSSYMIHEGSCCCEDLDAHKFLQHAGHYKNMLAQIKNTVVLNTQIDSDFYDKNKKDDWYFCAKEAIDFGIIDEIITDVNGGIFNER